MTEKELLNKIIKDKRGSHQDVTQDTLIAIKDNFVRKLNYYTELKVNSSRWIAEKCKSTISAYVDCITVLDEYIKG